MFLYEFLDLFSVVDDLPLEDAAVDLGGGEEEAAVVGEEAARDREEVIRVALVVALARRVRVVEQPDRPELVTHRHYRPPDYLANLCDFVTLREPIVDALKLRIAAQPLPKPLKLEVDSIRVYDSLSLNLEQEHLAEVVLALQIVVVCREVDVLDGGFEAVEGLHFGEAVLCVVEGDLGGGGTGRRDTQDSLVVV